MCLHNRTALFEYCISPVFRHHWPLALMWYELRFCSWSCLHINQKKKRAVSTWRTVNARAALRSWKIGHAKRYSGPSKPWNERCRGCARGRYSSRTPLESRSFLVSKTHSEKGTRVAYCDAFRDVEEEVVISQLRFSSLDLRKQREVTVRKIPWRGNPFRIRAARLQRVFAGQYLMQISNNCTWIAPFSSVLYPLSPAASA